jgi:hypothetical protein
MSERPILFGGPMVRAILEGRKTQTRRVITPQPTRDPYPCHYVRSGWALSDPWEHGVACTCKEIKFPYASARSNGVDCLWVRETFWPRPFRTPRDMREGADTWPQVFYDADSVNAEELKGWGWKRKPAIFLPRSVSRLILEILEVRAERLRDISEADAKAEGMVSHALGRRAVFMQGWDTINGKRKGCTWADNPWVWVIEFKKL